MRMLPSRIGPSRRDDAPARRPDRPRPRAPLTAVRALRNSVLFCGAFAVAAAVVRSRVPFPDIVPTRQKFEHVTASPEPYDTLFFGSSHTNRGIDPRTFDDRTRELGLATRSYNVGVYGTRWHECAWLTRRTLRELEHPVRFVFIEIANIEPRLHPDNRGTTREVSWHEPYFTLDAIRAELEQEDVPFHHTLEAIGFHALHLGRNRFSVGEGPRLLGLYEPIKVRKRFGYITRAEGYDGVRRGKGRPGIRRRQREFLASADSYRDEVEELRASERSKASPRWLVRATLEQARFVKSRGAVPIFYVPALKRHGPDLEFLAEAGVPVLRFDDPNRYAELYEVEERFDEFHLNHTGAQIWTRLLAARFVEVMRDRPDVSSATTPAGNGHGPEAAPGLLGRRSASPIDPRDIAGSARPRPSGGSR